MSGSTSKDNKTLRFSFIQAVYSIAAAGIIVTYIVPLYKYFGFSVTKIGILTAIAYISSIIAEPVLGSLCDGKRKTSAVVTIAMVIGLTAFSLIYFFHENMFVVVPSVILLYSTTPSLAYLISQWSVKLKNSGVDINFGISRAAGSLGYGIFAAVFGKLLDIKGYGIILPAFALFSVLTILLLITIKEPAAEKNIRDYALDEITQEVAGNSYDAAESENADIKNGGGENKEGAKEGGSKSGISKSGYAELLKSRKYVLLALSALITFIGSYCITVFLSLRISEMGGSTSEYGMAILIEGVVEVIAILFYEKIAKRISNYMAMVICFVLSFISAIVISFAVNIPVMYAGMAIHGIFTGFYVAGIALYIPEIVDRKYTYTAAMLVASCLSAAAALTSLYVAFITKIVSLQNAMQIAAIMPAIAIVVFAFSGRGSKDRNKK